MTFVSGSLEPLSAFPSNWYRIELSNKVTPSKIHTIQYFGKSFICIRGKDRVVRIFDAHCPHLGAHLGVGGKIKNDQIICPFHGWRFNLQGQCAQIPYCEKIPKRANLNSYIVSEQSGSIYMFYPRAELEICSEFPLNSLSQQQYYGNSAEVLQGDSLRPKIEKVFQDFQLNFLNSGMVICSSPSKSFTLLVTMTPVDASRSQVIVSYGLAKPWNIFLKWKIKKIIKNKIKSLLQPMEITA